MKTVRQAGVREGREYIHQLKKLSEEIIIILDLNRKLTF